MKNLFNQYPLMDMLAKRWKQLLVIQGLWLLLCLPVVTIGPATAALFYTIRKSIFQNEEKLVSLYFYSFKDNLKFGSVMTLLYGISMVVLLAVTSMLYQRHLEGYGYGQLYIGIIGLGVVFIVLILYSLAYISKFENNLKQSLKNPLFMMILNLKTNIKLMILVLVAGGLTVVFPWMIFILGGLAMYLSCYWLEQVFMQYEE